MIKYNSRRNNKGISYYPAVRDYALKFDGVNDYLQLPNDAAFSFIASDNLIMEFELKLLNNPTSKRLLFKDDGLGHTRTFDFEINNNILGFGFASNNVRFFYGSINISSFLNQNITVRVEKPNHNTIFIYLNGILQTTTIVLNTLLSTDNLTTGQPLSIGSTRGTANFANVILKSFKITKNGIMVFDLRPVYNKYIKTLNPANTFKAVTGQDVSIFGKLNPMSLVTDFEKI